MTHCLETKDSNCKNCYKCIRHCPVKSLKFTDGQAHIIREECVLCGECFVVCPQNAKQIRNDTDRIKKLISSGNDVYISLAPSFEAWYNQHSLSDLTSGIKKLGVKGVYKTAVGAAIVKKQYENIINTGKQSVVISSCCHTVNTLIERHYKKAIPYLANVVSPMEAHAALLKKEHSNCKVVFVGPCISKKSEIEKQESSVDVAITFEELDSLIAEANININETTHKNQEKFRTDVFPVKGGIIRSMNLNPEYRYVAVDGMENCINVLKDIDNGNLSKFFIEMSACSGSCIGGPVMKRKNRNPVMDSITINEGVSGNDYEVTLSGGSQLKKYFYSEGTTNIIPGNNAIEEILKKMGKNSKSQELNCGSCGYDTCRDKAAAVFMGKADLSMCLPFLKEKAESFSDTIIKNTPNGIIVLDDRLFIQQINKAARKILNLPNSTDIVGSPVVRILDPVDYIVALNNGKNEYENKKYLAEYQKYIEETIIYDKEFQILMIIMKDISQEERARSLKDNQSKAAIEITDKVVEKQMRVVQEIALLLGETTAETKIALTKLKETLCDE